MTANQLKFHELQETIRSNRERERETNRSNRVKEHETNRSNLVKELETNRSNLVNERLKANTLQETIRSNLENEGIKRGTLEETVRSNLSNELLRELEAEIKSLQTKINSQEVREMIRHNFETEMDTDAKRNADILNNVANQILGLGKIISNIFG